MTLPNLYHLKYFADAVQLGSISAASQKNLVTHPAISRAIKMLEKQLGLPLLIHQKKKFQVTPEGRKVAEQAQLLLIASREFNALNLKHDIEAPTHIKLGLSRSLSQAYLPTILKKLNHEFPFLKIQAVFGTTSEIVNKVAQNEIDLGITIGQNPMPTLRSVQLTQGNFILIQSKTMPTQNKDYFILTEPRYETEYLKREYYRQFKEQLNLKYEISSWDFITQMVIEGLGIGLVPDLAMTPEKRKVLTQFKASWFSCEYEVFLHYPKNPGVSPGLKIVSDAISKFSF